MSKVIRAARVDKEEWRRRVLDCRDSGLCIQDWCAQHGVHIDQFHRWKRVFRADGTIDSYPRDSRDPWVSPKATTSPTVVEVKLASPCTPSYTQQSTQSTLHSSILASQIVIETPDSGCHIYVGTGFSQETLRRVMEVVR